MSGNSDHYDLSDDTHGVKVGKVDNKDYWQEKQNLEKKGKKFFNQTIFYDWCKACGICIAFCPEKVFTRNESGKPVVDQPDKCIGCLFCELHCPDFAIAISERYPDRRKL